MSAYRSNGKKKTLFKTLGNELWSALKNGQAIEPLTRRGYGLTIDDAYEVQRHMLENRDKESTKIVGKKIGVTSVAVQELMNVHQPDFGWLTSDMHYADGGTVPMGRFIQPRVEGELAFLLRKPLKGPGVTAADVLDATEGVLPCIEIVDSRIADWDIRIEDTIADNASCGGFVIGESSVALTQVDVETVGLVIEKNERVVATGAGAASLGSPVTAVAWLANTMGRYGTSLDAGEIILSGALAPLVDIKAGDRIRVRLGGVGRCEVEFGN